MSSWNVIKSYRARSKMLKYFRSSEVLKPTSNPREGEFSRARKLYFKSGKLSSNSKFKSPSDFELLKCSKLNPKILRTNLISLKIVQFDRQKLNVYKADSNSSKS